jgi:hypothetical protein
MKTQNTRPCMKLCARYRRSRAGIMPVDYRSYGTEEAGQYPSLKQLQMR